MRPNDKLPHLKCSLSPLLNCISCPTKLKAQFRSLPTILSLKGALHHAKISLCSCDEFPPHLSMLTRSGLGSSRAAVVIPRVSQIRACACLSSHSPPCCVTATPLFLPLSCKYSQLELGPGSEVLCHTSTARRGSALYLDRLPSLFPAASPLVHPSSVSPIRSLPPLSLYTRPVFNYT